MATSCKMLNTNCTKYNISDWDSERYVDQLLCESDDTFFSCPTFDSEPDLLISKVRQHYMKYMVKLLSVNYETNQKLLNKNIYLPSGIWRCAKLIEMKAAQKSMVIQLYRKHIVTVINEVKKHTEKGKLYSNLLETIRTPPNDKKTQTSMATSTECNCKYFGNDNKRRRKSSTQVVDDVTPILQGNTGASGILTQLQDTTGTNTVLTQLQGNISACSALTQYKIPVALNMQTHTPEPVLKNKGKINTPQSKLNLKAIQTEIPNCTELVSQPVPVQQLIQVHKIMTPIHTENDSDDIMMQLEKLFHTDQTDDDLFDATFNNVEPKNVPQNETPVMFEESICRANDSGIENPPNTVHALKTNDLVIENHAAQIKSLDQRLATLTNILINNETNVPAQKEEQTNKNAHRKELKRKKMVSKWHCEEYFLKKNLLELLYQIGDNNRNKLARIKALYLQLFGPDDDDDEEILSPIEESPQLVSSCKTRISMWVLTTLTPYYGMGRIQGKNLFKSVVKYLIDLIFKCKQYPDEREVTSFVQDFIQNHAMITCEADYRDIIDNVRQAPYTFG